ncbi:MAG: hypothetical protein WBG50_22620 [Desulfomonilaceae bacterium]
MQCPRIVGRIWHDPVWSKVIAGLILLLLAGAGVGAYIAGTLSRLASSIKIGSDLVIEHPQLFLWLFMAATIIMLCLMAYILKLRFRLNQTVILLDKSASVNIWNWDYTGNWSVASDILDITNCGDGGLLKWGSEWKNYDFNFQFKIVNDWAAWIVRAQGHRRCVMIQCGGDLIRPHIRTAPTHAGDPDPGFRVLDTHRHGLVLKEWNKVSAQIRGGCIRIFINDQLAFEDPRLLQNFTSGTVGFRCSGPERALFRDVEVIHKANAGW